MFNMTKNNDKISQFHYFILTDINPKIVTFFQFLCMFMQR